MKKPNRFPKELNEKLKKILNQSQSEIDSKTIEVLEKTFKEILNASDTTFREKLMFTLETYQNFNIGSDARPVCQFSAEFSKEAKDLIIKESLRILADNKFSVDSRLLKIQKLLDVLP